MEDTGAAAAPAQQEAAAPAAVSDFKQTWLAPIVTGCVAFVSAALLALRQDAVSDTRSYRDLRIRHADSAVQAMADYVLQWRRLMVQCRQSVAQERVAAQLTAEGKLSPQDREILQKRRDSVEDIARGRRPKRERLVAELDMLRLYFSEKVDRQVAAFKAWDEDNEAKTCDHMPSEQALVQHQARLVDLLRDEVK